MDNSALLSGCAGAGVGRVPDWVGLESGYDSVQNLARSCHSCDLCNQYLAGHPERKGMKTMGVKVFIDGQAGTTGLRILDRFANREDITLLQIDPEKRKDAEERKRLINSSDYTFLCLPDAAAREAVSLVENPDVRIIDASTAHRIQPDWAYGFPELSAAHREKIRTSKRVAVPGCYASGFNALVYPLVQHGVIAETYPVQCFAVSGYSGGGNKMIAEIESPDCPAESKSPRFYGLANNHKHLPEMQKISGLANAPMFTPIVDDFFNGMVVCVSVQSAIAGHTVTPEQVHTMFADHYKGQQFVKVMPLLPEAEMTAYKLSSNDLRDTNLMQIFVFGSADQVLLCARLDNLGKGASGAAVQCLNIMMGIDETTGLL